MKIPEPKDEFDRISSQFDDHFGEAQSLRRAIEAQSPELTFRPMQSRRLIERRAMDRRQAQWRRAERRGQVASQE
jgi:hypothetical protein